MKLLFFHSNCIVWFNYLKNKLKNIEEDAGIAIGLLCTTYFCDMNYLNVGVRKTRRGYWDRKLHACVALFNDKVLFICLIYLLLRSTLFCIHVEAMFTCFTDFYYCSGYANKFPINGRIHLIFHGCTFYVAFSVYCLFKSAILVDFISNILKVNLLQRCMSKYSKFLLKSFFFWKEQIKHIQFVLFSIKNIFYMRITIFL